VYATCVHCRSGIGTARDVSWTRSKNQSIANVGEPELGSMRPCENGPPRSIVPTDTPMLL
jgi:hypothetical protein